MCAIAARFDGSVHTAGDGIVAIFGAPHAQEGHALLACEAALAMQASIPRAGEGLCIRVGLHSGSIVSAVLASHPTREPNAYGITVHLANRMQELAQANRIYLTEDCYRLVRAYCDVDPLGPHPIKNLEKHLEVYELLRLKPAVASQQFRRSNLTVFRGRDYEMEVLRRALQDAEAGAPEVIGISGAAGLGKSRLCYEFAEWCRERFIPVLETRAQIYGHATPLQSALDFIRLLFRIEPDEDARQARARVAERVLAVAPTFEADLPFLFEFLGMSLPEDIPSRLTPKARHARLLDIIRHLVRHESARANVIIVEDLHWLDPASEEFVTMLVESVENSRTMLVLNFRPSFSASWMKWPYYKQLSLSELSPFQTQALVEELLGPGEKFEEICRRIARNSGGNPFFAEELVRSLVDLAGEAGAHAVNGGAIDAPLPPTVEAVIAARIDRLNEDEKSVLQVGAIIGKEFPLAVIQQVIGPTKSELNATLGQLCQAELLQEQGSNDGRIFAFRHPLIQEVAYSGQLKTRRRAIHASVAKVMESHYAGRLNEFAGLISYHHEAAGQSVEAANYAAQAAAWLGSTNPAQAIKHWEKVRLLLKDKPRSVSNDKLLMTADGQIGWLGWREGMTAEAAQPLIAEALQLARETDDSMVPMLLFVQGRITVASGGPADLYVEHVKEALRLLKDSTPKGRRATLNCALSQAYGWAGLLKDALVASDDAIRGVSEISDADHQFLGYSVEHWLNSLRGRILVRQGRLDEARACFQTVLDIEGSLLDPTLQFIPHLGYVDLAAYVGDAALANRHARRVSEIAEATGSAYVKVYAFACAGTAKFLGGDFTGAAGDFSDSLTFLRNTTASVGYEPEILASLAECHDRMEQPEQAIAFAREAIARAQRQTTRLPECRASIILGAALLHARGAAGCPEADALFRRAEEMIEMTGAETYRPLLLRAKASAPA
jgi:adenylate cyclase